MKRTIILATAFVLSSSLAFAQAGGANSGAAVPERSGTAVTGTGAATNDVGTSGRQEMKPTTGMSNSATPGAEPGARDKSRPGGQGVNDKPAGN